MQRRHTFHGGGGSGGGRVSRERPAELCSFQLTPKKTFYSSERGVCCAPSRYYKQCAWEGRLLWCVCVRKSMLLECVHQSSRCRHRLSLHNNILEKNEPCSRRINFSNKVLQLTGSSTTFTDEECLVSSKWIPF